MPSVKHEVKGYSKAPSKGSFRAATCRRFESRRRKRPIPSHPIKRGEARAQACDLMRIRGEGGTALGTRGVLATEMHLWGFEKQFGAALLAPGTSAFSRKRNDIYKHISPARLASPGAVCHLNCCITVIAGKIPNLWCSEKIIVLCHINLGRNESHFLLHRNTYLLSRVVIFFSRPALLSGDAGAHLSSVQSPYHPLSCCCRVVFHHHIATYCAKASLVLQRMA